MNFGDKSVFLLSLSDFDILNALSILISDILFAFDDGLFDEIQSLPMHLFNLIFFLGPFPNFLVLHKSPPHVKTGLIGDGREGVLEPCPFAVELYIVKDVNSCW